MPARKSGSETRQALAGARPNRGAQGGVRAAAGCSLSSRVGRIDGWPSPPLMRIGVGTELGLQAASRDSVLVFAPDRASCACVADGSSLVHGPERQRMLRTAEQAVDLDAGWDAGWVAGNDAHMAYRAAADPTGSRDRSALFAPLDWVHRHVVASVVPRMLSQRLRLPGVACGQQWRVRTMP